MSAKPNPKPPESHGGKREGAGRPATLGKKKVMRQIYFHPGVLDYLEDAAAQKGQSLGDFISAKALPADVLQTILSK